MKSTKLPIPRRSSTEPTKLPKHKKSCAYMANPRDLCNCGAKAIGKPFTHWQAMADELVADALLRALHNINYLSIPGQLAEAQLKEIILQLKPEVIQKVLDERQRAMDGLEKALAEIVGGQ